MPVGTTGTSKRTSAKNQGVPNLYGVQLDPGCIHITSNAYELSYMHSSNKHKQTSNVTLDRRWRYAQTLYVSTQLCNRETHQRNRDS